jgi:hypothetical protein
MMAEEKNRKMVEIETIERGAENVPVNFMIVDTRHEREIDLYILSHRMNPTTEK